MSEDLSDIMSSLNKMIKNNEIPDDLKNIIGSFSSSSENSSESNQTSSENSFPEIDLNTILKMKTLMDSMKTNKDDPRTNLLLSLKPYLKEDRKKKVDQYVKLFGLSKVIDVINPLGGEKHDSK